MRLSSLCLCGLAACTPFAQASDQSAGFMNGLAEASRDPAFALLEQHQHQALLQRLRQDAQPFDQTHIEKTHQHAPLANEAWLAGKAYDFHAERLQTADADLLDGFSNLSSTSLAASTATVARINHAATPYLQARALDDADGYPYLYFLVDALGPTLGEAFLHAYEAGELGKAAALIKASEISTGTAKRRFNYPRPFQRAEQPVALVADQRIVADGHPYTAAGGAFPSGHTTMGYTDALLLAAMLPERAAALLARGAGYGYSRQVLGVHYPLDVIGGRMIAQYNVAHYLADAAYRPLFDEARAELRAALAKACGRPLTECAASGAPAQDPWASPAAREFARYTLTYDLPAAGSDGLLQVPTEASVLLTLLSPDGTSATPRWVQGDGVAELGLDPIGAQWQRLDLLAALSLRAAAK